VFLFFALIGGNRDIHHMGTLTGYFCSSHNCTHNCSRSSKRGCL